MDEKWGPSGVNSELFGTHSMLKIASAQWAAVLLIIVLVRPYFLLYRTDPLAAPRLHILKAILLATLVAVGTCYVPNMLEHHKNIKQP